MVWGIGFGVETEIDGPSLAQFDASGFSEWFLSTDFCTRIIFSMPKYLLPTQ